MRIVSNLVVEESFGFSVLLFKDRKAIDKRDEMLLLLFEGRNGGRLYL